jgi:beta-xylosidase
MRTLLLLLLAIPAAAQTVPTSGNPIFPGWYADPEATIFDHTYWVYPTYSDKYDKQVFFDAFSSPDLIHWTKHPHILDTTSVRWAHRAMWAPAINYYIVYHRRPLGETDPNHRVTCIDRMTFAPDGRIHPVTITKTGVPARPIR